MKKKLALSLALIIATLAAGCAQETTSGAASETLLTEEASQDTEAADEEQSKPVNAVIYYGNTNADGFEKKDVQLDALTPENLIAELAAVDVVSGDTQVNSFDRTDQSLQLDLSGDFSTYVSGMGTDGEYLVIGSLVNTFLTAYGADEISVTVDGQDLETGHAVYDQPLGFFGAEDAADSEEKTPISYELKDESYTQDAVRIYYPQFINMSDSGLQDQWNEAIREITVGAAEARASEDQSYQVDYRIASAGTELVSFVFTRETETADGSASDLFAISFDMTEGKNIRLSDWGEAADTAAYNLATQGYYRILSDDVDREAYDEAMKTEVLSTEEYQTEFAQFDFDLENLAQTPAGTSYVEDGELILIMNVSDELGGSLEIATGIQVTE